MDMSELKGKSYTVAIYETTVMNDKTLKEYEQYLDDNEHTLECLQEFLGDRMTNIYEMSSNAILVIKEEKGNN
jgi:hypothetical protein